MILPISVYRIKRILIDQWSLFVSFGVFLLLLIVIMIFYFRFDDQKKEVALMEKEVAVLKNRYDTLKFNTYLTVDQIKEYNTLLAGLVPDTEDFFSVIYAMEKISEVSGFDITNYSINMVGNTERLPLVITGKGNAEAFLLFLQEYQFAGGRLVTSNKIQYAGANEGATEITLNFYHKDYIPNETIPVTQLSKEEIAKLEEIKKKIKLEYGTTQAVSTDYDTKNNPFAGSTK